MNILVTGGAGYIGSHACKALAAKGYVPITDDNLSRGHRWAVKWGPLLQGDTADPVRLRAALEQYRPALLSQQSCRHRLTVGNHHRVSQHSWCSRRAAPFTANPSTFPFRRTIRGGRSTPMGTPSCLWNRFWRILRARTSCAGLRYAILTRRAPIRT